MRILPAYCLVWIGSFSLLSGCGVLSNDEDVGLAQDDIVGGAIVDGIRTGVVGAVGRLLFPGGGFGCSGTLVERPDRVLFASHCVCGRPTAGWTFVLPTNSGAATFTGNAVVQPEFDCDDTATKGNDLAILRLDTPVPSSVATPASVYLGERFGDFENTFGLSVGFGAFSDDAPSVDCDVQPPNSQFDGLRRQFNPFIFTHFDPCDTLIDGSCINARHWASRVGNPRAGEGDSGGPLIGTRNGQQLVIGSLNGERCPDPFVSGPNLTVWSMTRGPATGGPAAQIGVNASFLARELLPLTHDTASILRNAAVYGVFEAKINDRASVVNAGSVIVATPFGNSSSTLHVGVDAKVERLFGGGLVELRDRVFATGVTTSLLRASSTARTGPVTTDTVIRIPDILSDLRIREPTLPSSRRPNYISRPDVSPSVSPGEYQSITIDGPAFFSPGVYIADQIIFNSGANVLFDASTGPIYIIARLTLIMRGRVDSSPLRPGTPLGFQPLAADVVIAYAGQFGSTAHIETPIGATILAPHAKVIIDTVTDLPGLVGAVLASQVEVHQGKQVKFAPFRHSFAPVLQ